MKIVIDIPDERVEYMKVWNEAMHNKLSWEEAISRIPDPEPIYKRGRK